MNRRNRIALLLAGVLVVGVAGTVFATRQAPKAEEPAQVTQDEEETPPTAEEIAHARSRLLARSFDIGEAEFAELVGVYGVGGAVRIVAWSYQNDRDLDIAGLRELRDTGGPEGTQMGWGRIAKEIGVHPGIGSIMGNGGGVGREDAPGQNREEEDGSGG